MKNSWKGRVPISLLVAAVALAAIGVTALLLLDREDEPAEPKTVTVRVDTADPGTASDEPMRVPASAVADARRSDANDHGGLSDETPAGVPDEVIDDARAQQDRLAETDQLPIVTPLAAPFQRGCRTRIVSNSSSRRGVRPRVIVLHYTVSPNRPGWADVDGITAYFDNPGSQASSHYVIDRDGLCNYIVREYDKAWTQAAANPVSISIEVINSGREHPFMTDAGYRKVGQVIADAAKRWQIPIRRGQVSGATVHRSGIVQHADFGGAGGGHHDIGPFPFGPVLEAAAEASRAATCGPKCQRRKEHAQVLERLRELGCSDPTQRARHPNACRRLTERERALREAGL